MIVPLFSLSAANATGFNGFERGLEGLALRDQVNAQIRDDYLRDLQFQSTLDTIGRFADARQANPGLSPEAIAQGVFQGSLNPLSAQNSLNIATNFNAQQLRNSQVDQLRGIPTLSQFAQPGAQQPTALGDTTIRAAQPNPIEALPGFPTIQAQPQGPLPSVIQTPQGPLQTFVTQQPLGPVIQQQQATQATQAPPITPQVQQTQIQQNAEQIQEAIRQNTLQQDAERQRQAAQTQSVAVTNPTEVREPIRPTSSTLFPDREGNFFRQNAPQQRTNSLFDLISFGI